MVLHFPHMHTDKLLIFTQFDSDPKARARYCFHTAFNDPTIPADAPARQSIEVRAVALFNETMAAPPPLVRNLSDEVFQARTAPAAREAVHGARGKRKLPPVRTQKLRDAATERKPSERLVPVDLDFDVQLALAIEDSLAVDVA